MASGKTLGPRQANKRGNEQVPRGGDIPEREPSPDSRSDRSAGQDRIDHKGIGLYEDLHEPPLTEPPRH